MSDSLSFLQALSLKQTAFPETSRYHGIDTIAMESDSGEQVVYLSRRFVPQPDKFAVIQQYIVSEGERLDNLANQFYGDPELFWMICDANGTIRPNELVESIGNKILITLPQGIPGTSND